GAISRGRRVDQRADRQIRHKDGRIVVLDCSLTALQSPDGRGGFQGTARDMTEYRALQAELLRSEKLRALGTLASGVAHDFNNLLALILGQAEVARTGLERGQLSRPATTAALRRIEQAAADGAAIAARLQEVSPRGEVEAPQTLDLA